MIHENCSRPGEAIYTAKILSRDGTVRPFDLSDVSLSWGRGTNQIVETTIATEENIMFCCEYQLNPFDDKIYVYRDDKRVGVFDYYKDLPNTSNSTNVLYFDSRMYLISRQVWLADLLASYHPVDAFTRVLQEAERSGVHANYQPIHFTSEKASVKGYTSRALDQTIANLSGWLEWTEYSDSSHESVVRYGDIKYETGQKLVNDHWEDAIPQIVTDGKRAATSVIVHSNLSSDRTANDVVGWWPRQKDGSLVTGILPLPVENKDVSTTAEASALAKRLYEKAANYASIRFSGAGRLSTSFPVCVCDLYPGAVFDVEAENGCGLATGKYYIDSLVFDVVRGREASVEAELVKVVETI